MEHAEKMRLNKSKTNKTDDTIIEKKTTKARLIKGSEEAKEFGKKMAEMRALKKAQIEPVKEEPKETKKRVLKPWFYIGDIPSGYREASEDEAIEKNKVSKYGKYQVDEIKFRFWTEYHVLLSEGLTDNKLSMNLLLIKKKIIKTLKEIEILETKTQNPKHENKISSINTKLESEKYNSKLLHKGLNWLWRLYCKRNNKEYKKPIIKLEVPDLKYTPTHSNENIEKKSNFIDNVSENDEKNKDEVISKDYAFNNDNLSVRIPSKAFDENMVLFPKYAKKLLKKNIILLPKFYTKEDQEKYFYKQSIEGGSLVKRTPPYEKNHIIQSIVFDRTDWTIPKAKKWLKDNNHYSDSMDNNKKQIRFRQYNPEQLKNRYYISKKIDDEGITFIISVRNPMDISYIHALKEK